MGITGPDDPMLALVRIPHGEIRYWTSTPDMQENVDKVSF